MKSNDVHILKEGQEKKLNQVIHLIGKNEFPSIEIKENLMSDAVNALEIVREQRVMIYKDTDNADHLFEKYNPEEGTNNIHVTIDDNFNTIKNEIIALVNDVIADEKNIRPEVITGSSNYEKIKNINAYNEYTQNLMSDLSYIIAQLLDEEKENTEALKEEIVNHDGEVQLTAADFEKYPELTNATLTIGDWVKSPLETFIEEIQAKMNAGISKTIYMDVNPENKDKHQLTEGDFDANPYLAKMGLNVGDWVTPETLKTEEPYSPGTETGEKKN